MSTALELRRQPVYNLQSTTSPTTTGLVYNHSGNRRPEGNSTKLFQDRAQEYSSNSVNYLRSANDNTRLVVFNCRSTNNNWRQRVFGLFDVYCCPSTEAFKNSLPPAVLKELIHTRTRLSML